MDPAVDSLIAGRSFESRGAVPPAAPVIVSVGDPLSDRARHLLEVASIWDGPFSAEEAAELLGEPVASLLPSLEAVLDAGVLHWAGDQLTFVDDARRRAYYLDLPEPIRTALHRQVGRRLAADPTAGDRALSHLSRGSRPGHVADLADLDAAVAATVASTPGTAADAAMRAVELSGPDDGRRGARSVVAARALIGAGRTREALDLARRAVRSSDDVVAVAQLRLMLSTISFLANDWEESNEHAAAVLSEPGLPDQLYAQAKLAQLRSFMSAGNEPGMRSLVTAIMAGSDGLGDDAALAAAFVVNAQWAWDAGSPTDAISFLRAAVERSERAPGHVPSGHPRLLLAAALTSIGDGVEAKRLVDLDAEHIREASDTPWLPAVAIQSAWLALTEGRPVDALGLARTGLGEAAAQGISYFSSLAWAVAATAALQVGDIAQASAAVGRGLARRATDIGFYGESAIVLARARVDEAIEGPEAVIGPLTAACAEPVRLHRMLLEDPAAAAWWVRVALATGRRALADEVVLTAEHLAKSSPQLPRLTASAQHARGLFDHDAGTLEAAVVGHSQPWAKASAAEDAGRVAADADGAVAYSCMEMARAEYELAGAVRDAERVGRAMGRLGRPGRGKPGGVRPAVGWASLTDAERRVALAVARGGTNAEVAAGLHLSRHTVDFHLRHVFSKLSVDSRVELAWSVATRGVGHL